MKAVLMAERRADLSEMTTAAQKVRRWAAKMAAHSAARWDFRSAERMVVTTVVSMAAYLVDSWVYNLVARRVHYLAGQRAGP